MDGETPRTKGRTTENVEDKGNCGGTSDWGNGGSYPPDPILDGWLQQTPKPKSDNSECKKVQYWEQLRSCAEPASSQASGYDPILKEVPPQWARK